MFRAWFLWLALLQLQQLAHFGGVHADVLLQLVVYSNEDVAIEEATNTTAEALMDTLISVEPEGFQAVQPGEEVPSSGNRRRGLRNLQVSYCPAKCAYKTSPYCRSLGCAFCGQTCVGRLRALLDGGEVAAVEADMDDALAPFCAGGGCEIGAKILLVDEDGNTTELVV